MKIVARNALTICLFSFAPFSSAHAALDEWPAATHDGPILVQLEDGRTIEAVGPVTGDDRTLIVRLPDDSMVSVRIETVERITAGSSSPRKPVPAPGPPPGPRRAEARHARRCRERAEGRRGPPRRAEGRDRRSFDRSTRGRSASRLATLNQPYEFRSRGSTS